MNDFVSENQKAALFISPHLDDAVFSCGGTLLKMRKAGWRTILCTVFTKSVINPQGFALACQLDKNLAPDVDYMKLRRGEDCRAAKILNVSEVLHLNLPEAPHRGYHSAPELFAGVKSKDAIQKSVADHFRLIADIHQPNIIFVPQGLGNHCDHLQTINAALEVFDLERIRWYFDTPYIIRQPDAKNYRHLPQNLIRRQTDITGEIARKITACIEYKSQIEFQFGGVEKLEQALRKLHQTSKINDADSYNESFLVKQSSLAESDKIVI